MTAGEPSAARLAPGWFGLPPLVALLAALPLLGLVLAGTPHALFAVPVYAALLAAPGYVACLVAEPARLRASRVRRLWIRASLAVLLACSLAGVWAGAYALVFALPSLATLGCCVVVWWRFERLRLGPRGVGPRPPA